MAVQNMNFIKDQVYFSRKVGMLMKGTSDDESPISGYLYKEITDLSFESPAHCEFLLEFMVKRLSKNSCHVKYKTLKLMKHLVEEGEANFRRGLHRKSGCIQDATKFGGPPDPLRGNVPYQAVRQTAKELSSILSELNMFQLPQQSQNQRKERNMGGIGSARPGAGGKYGGFGNSPLETKTLGSTIKEGIEKLAEQLGETPAQRQAALLADLERSNGGDYVPPVVGSPLQLPPAVVKMEPPPKKVVVKSYAPGRAGGGWDSAENDASPSQSSGSHSEEGDELADRSENTPTADWSAEEQVVREHLLLDNTSQFTLLRPSQMKVFKQKCHKLNCEKVVDCINEWMKSSDDYVLVRAMLLLETFLFRNDAVSLDYIASVCQNQLFSLAHSSSDQRIVAKAEKIIRILEAYSSHPSILVPIDQPS